MISNDEIKSKIAIELNEIIESDSSFNGYSIKIENEQTFAKIKDVKEKTIFIVLHFQSASLNFGQTVLPFIMTVVSEKNNFNTAFSLMSAFCNTYNLSKNTEEGIVQVYTSPQIIANFQVIDTGYRSLLIVNGSFVVGSGCLFIKKVQYKRSESEIFDCSFLNTTISFDGTPLPEPTGDSKGRNITTIQSETHTISCNSYLLDCELFNDIIDNKINGHINSKIHLIITITNGSVEKIIEHDYKATSFVISDTVANIPSVSIMFTL